MTHCEAIRADLVALTQGELDPSRRAEVDSHLGACAACVTERDALLGTLGRVRAGIEIEPSAGATERLEAALDAELARPAPAGEILRPAFGDRVRSAWAFVQWRTETSPPLRRFVAASLVAHAAALAFAAWIIFEDVSGDRGAHITWGTQAEQLDPFVDGVEDTGPGRPVAEETGTDEEDPSFGPAWTPAPPDGIDAAKDVTAGAGASGEMRFPTVSVFLRYRSLYDESDRRQQLRSHAGRHADDAMEGIKRGLEWLGEHRADDGTWGAGGADLETRTGVTGAVLMAFLNGGRSAVRGDEATLLGPAVRHLEAFVAKTPATGGGKPLYAYSLAVRALAVQYSLDFRHLEAGARKDRRTLLEHAGRQLATWQAEDGGFGYRPDDPRTDASCTLFACAALADLRAAGILDTRETLLRAGRYLDTRLRQEGVLDYKLARDRDGDLALTAGYVALGRQIGRAKTLKSSIRAVEKAAADLRTPDALLLVSATEGLRRHGKRIEGPVGKLVSSQQKDGSWPSATDRHLRLGGDAVTTAFAVIGLSNTYVRPH